MIAGTLALVVVLAASADPAAALDMSVGSSSTRSSTQLQPAQQQATHPSTNVTLPRHTHNAVLDLTALPPVQPNTYMTVQLGQSTGPVGYGQAVQVAMTLQSNACEYVVSFRDDGLPSGLPSGQAYQIVVVYPDLSSITSAVSSHPVITVTSSVPTPVDVTVWVLAAGSSDADLAVGGVLRQRYASSCMNDAHRASQGLPPWDPKMPLLRTPAGDPVPLTVEQISAEGQLSMSSAGAPMQANSIALLPPHTRDFNITVRGYGAQFDKCQGPVRYALQGAAVQGGTKLVCTAKHADDACGYMTDCTIPGDEPAVALVSKQDGAVGSGFPVAVSLTVVAGPATEGTVLAPGKKQPQPPAIPTVTIQPALRRRLLANAAATNDDPPSLQPTKSIDWATTTYTTVLNGIAYRDHVTLKYSISSQCHLSWHFTPTGDSRFPTKLLLTVGEQTLATSLTEQDPVLVWDRDTPTPVDAYVTVMVEGMTPKGVSIGGDLQFQAKGSCSGSLEAVHMAYARPAPGPVVLWHPMNASGTGLQGTIGATRLTAVDFEGSVTPDSNDAPLTTTQMVLLSPSVPAGTAISVTERTQGPGDCSKDTPNDPPSYVFDAATTNRGLEKVCDPKPCDGAPCGCIAGCALTEDMVALELTASTQADRKSKSVELGAAWSASVSWCASDGDCGE